MNLRRKDRLQSLARPTYLAGLMLLTLQGLACGPEETLEPEEEGEAPLAEVVEPTPLEVDQWLVGFLENLSNDVVASSIEDGSFEKPEEGYDENDTHWLDMDVGENGSIGSYTTSYYYVVPDLDEDLDAGDRIIVRSAATYGTWIGSQKQPGYFYTDRRHRIPMLAEQDNAVIAVQAMGYRNAELEFWSTPDELWMNPHDLTRPDLPVGETGEHWLGIPVLNLTDQALPGAVVRVVENDHFEASETSIGSLPPEATTQVAALLQLKAPPEDPETPLIATIRLVAPGLEYSYQRDFEIEVIDPDLGRWATFRSPIDGSVQSFGLRRPLNFNPDQEYALVLSLHGASVQARGQARSYEAREWAYIIAPTNRHPFGFDWEEWGRFNALSTLDHSMERFSIDPTQVYLVGHSMGGHGTWHLGATTPGRFATLGPSAGWESFYSYSGSSRPSGATARARAHSDTLVYLENLAQRGVYIIHGDADDNVPVSEGRNMFAAVSEVSDDVTYHEQEGAGHWWDLDGEEEGADCVDWDPLFSFMQERRLDPTELSFRFQSPVASYSSQHSYVTLQSSIDPYADLVLESSEEAGAVNLSTTNVRSMDLDGGALIEAGATSLSVDGDSIELIEGTIHVGAKDGKTSTQHGPFNQVYRSPFCWVYPEEGGVAKDYASFLSSYWAILGNGHACAVSDAQLTDALRSERNLIWVGVEADQVNSSLPFDWTEDEIDLGPVDFDSGGLQAVFPDGDRLGAVVHVTEDDPHLLYRRTPFSSRSGTPDFEVFFRSGYPVSGMFTADWEYVPGQ